MTYDESIQKAEQLIVQLEQSGPIGAKEYHEKAQEIKELLDTCESELHKINFE
ncbi:MAG: hypothetical protein K5660_05540 [Paludibacteraceae bacterium]|nr:hypothetical protein [Paludibacteraceae bacterium]